MVCRLEFLIVTLSGLRLGIVLLEDISLALPFACSFSVSIYTLCLFHPYFNNLELPSSSGPPILMVRWKIPSLQLCSACPRPPSSTSHCLLAISGASSSGSECSAITYTISTPSLLSLSWLVGSPTVQMIHSTKALVKICV